MGTATDDRSDTHTHLKGTEEALCHESWLRARGSKGGTRGLGVLEAGGKAGPTQGVGSLRPQLSAWGFSSGLFSRSHGLAGESPSSSCGLCSERGRGCAEWSTCVLIYIGYMLCYMPESEMCAHVCAYRLGSPCAHSPCGPCKDVRHRRGGWHQVGVVRGTRNSSQSTCAWVPVSP